MRIAYIDPGLSCRKGHNAAMVEEFDQALVAERGHQVSYLVAADTDRREFSDLRGALRPTFRINGYAKLAPADLFDPQRVGRINDVMATDLAGAAVLTECDAILMPTAYPLHLHALAQTASQWPGRRVVLGLLLPARFWGADDARERRISELLAQSVDALSATTDLIAYSETGSYRFGDKLVPMATLLPPLARPSAGQVQRLAQRHSACASLRLGFFGSPFTTKGFGLLVQAAQELAQQGNASAVQLVLRLPAGHEAACAQLNALAPWIDAQSRQTGNSQYLAEMAAVDAVFAFYDPQEYGSKMSGIVPEAISLGKPLLIAEGCHAIQDFLERHAPGSFVVGAYEVQVIANVLGLRNTHWARLAACAQRHAALMQQMKCMDRYLAVCGLN